MGEIPIDPVCGMTVDKAAAAGSLDYDGNTYYFCSSHCLQSFRQDPQRFLTKGRNPTVKEGVEAELHDHRSAPSLTVGSPQAIEYTCPMHPEIVRDTRAVVRFAGWRLSREPSHWKTKRTLSSST